MRFGRPARGARRTTCRGSVAWRKPRCACTRSTFSRYTEASDRGGEQTKKILATWDPSLLVKIMKNDRNCSHFVEKYANDHEMVAHFRLGDKPFPDYTSLIKRLDHQEITAFNISDIYLLSGMHRNINIEASHRYMMNVMNHLKSMHKNVSFLQRRYPARHRHDHSRNFPAHFSLQCETQWLANCC